MVQTMEGNGSWIMQPATNKQKQIPLILLTLNIDITAKV